MLPKDGSARVYGYNDRDELTSAKRYWGWTQGSELPIRILRAHRLGEAMRWTRIVLAVERGKGEKWMQFRDRYGDWGRDAALWLGRRCGRLKLAELGRLAGGMGEQVVSRAVREFD